MGKEIERARKTGQVQDIADRFDLDARKQQDFTDTLEGRVAGRNIVYHVQLQSQGFVDRLPVTYGDIGVLHVNQVAAQLIYMYRGFRFVMVPTPSVLLAGHSFVRRFKERAADRGQTVAEAAGIEEVASLHTIYADGATFERALHPSTSLVVQLRELHELPDITIVDIGTNDLWAIGATVRGW